MKKTWMGLVTVLAFALAGLGAVTAPASAQEPGPCGTFFVVHPSQPPLGPWPTDVTGPAIFGAIFGDNVPVGETVGVTVEDPQTPQSPDFSTWTQVTDGNGNFQRWPLGFGSLRVGDLVTMTDLAAGCSLTTTISNLVVTQVDPFANTVQGTAQHGSQVTVGLLVTSGIIGLQEATTVGRNGRWLVSYAGIADLSTGQQGFAMQTDANGLGTWVIFGSEVWPATTLSVMPDKGVVDGQAVTVTGSAYQPGTTVGFGMCVGTIGPTTCGLTYGTPSAVADAHGNFTTTVQVKRIITIYPNYPDFSTHVDVDCQFATCGVSAVGVGSVFRFGPAPVRFSAEPCKNSGWQSLTDAQGNPFKNQGACVKATVT